ncbi:MAG: PAS domain S-box protein [Spirochaetales bacterium]|nr:PAS domain S-box protein [Spirochaetales bacterium]
MPDTTFESEDRYQILFEQAGEAIALVDPASGKILETNRNATALLGFTKEELCKMHIADLDVNESNEQVIYHAKAVVKAGNETFETKKRCKDGRIIDVEVSSKRIQFHGKTVLQSIWRDVTEQKHIREKLVEQERKFRSLIENSTDAISLIDINGRVLYNSPSYHRMMGYPEEDRIGQNTFDLVHPDDRENLLKLFRDIIAKPAYTGIPPTRVRHKNGSWRWIEGVANNQLAVPGVNAIVVNYRDITKRRQTEQALQQTQKIEALGVLAGGIAHDFNNLLGGIFGFIELAAELTKEKEVGIFLAKALGTVDRARGLTHQLLTFAKGGVPIKRLENITTFIHETVQFALSGSRLSCEFNIPENLWACEFDRNQIEQVSDNLIINAQQAMPDGGRIEVMAENIVIKGKKHPILDPGNYVKISISDQGIGMPGDILPRIFDPFYTTKPKGHGLGLATCYSIINRHGGCIEVESEPGKGSTFHVFLPALPKSAVKKATRYQSGYRGAGTILVMDDEAVIRETTEVMLKSFGFSVICTKDGSEVMQYLSSEITGIILDLTIPGGRGGKDTVTEIRKIDSGIPVFVMSGYADDPIMASPGEYGFTASICKPFTKIELAEMLDKHLGKENSG